MNRFGNTEESVFRQGEVAPRRGERGTRPRIVTLGFRPPYDWAAMLAFLAARAIPGVECVGEDCYRRTILLAGQAGSISVRRAHETALTATIRGAARGPAIEGRIRRLFDLDAEPLHIAAHLARDPLLAERVAERPGLRVPGAWDGFELGVRAILGQQITVAAATRLAGKLVAAYGRPFAPGVGDAGLRFVFPAPDRLVGADLAARLGMPRARGRAIAALAAAASDPSLFTPGVGLDAAVRRLTQLPGIGEWTAQYIALRALGETDAFPAADIGLLRALATASGRPSPRQLLARAEAWRPWRAYAVLHLWAGAASPTGPVGRGETS